MFIDPETKTKIVISGDSSPKELQELVSLN
jgi:hypothetical protein